MLHEAIFLKLFDAAQIACFNPTERRAYEDSLKHYRDLKNAVDTAREEGLEEGIQKGREEGMRQSILALHSNGFDTASIAKNLGISLAMVESVMSAVGKWE